MEGGRTSWQEVWEEFQRDMASSCFCFSEMNGTDFVSPQFPHEFFTPCKPSYFRPLSSQGCLGAPGVGGCPGFWWGWATPAWGGAHTHRPGVLYGWVRRALGRRWPRVTAQKCQTEKGGRQRIRNQVSSKVSTTEISWERTGQEAESREILEVQVLRWWEGRVVHGEPIHRPQQG